jgi:hypothetical protein
MYYIKRKWTTARKSEFKGSIYDSNFEASYAKELDQRQKNGEIERWERQVKIPLEVNGFHICNYYIDFIVYYFDGTIEYVECKGWATEVWKLKWKIFEAKYSEKPNVRLTVVQQRQFRLPKARRIKK